MVSVRRLPWINRPLRREELEAMSTRSLYVSATPGDYEMKQTDTVIEQIIRPTGLSRSRGGSAPYHGMTNGRLLGEINARRTGRADPCHDLDQEDGRT